MSRDVIVCSRFEMNYRNLCGYTVRHLFVWNIRHTHPLYVDLTVGKLLVGPGVRCCHLYEVWFSTDAYDFLEHLRFHIPFQVYIIVLIFLNFIFIS